jgi:hypothetical protein
VHCLFAHIAQFLADHTTAIQAVAAIAGVLLTAALAVTTVVYAVTTNRILQESRKTREAAEKQATASQENLELLKQQLASQLGLGPQILRESILDAKRLVTYWMEQAASIAYPPHGNPDPSGLANSSLVPAVDYARKISDECAELVLEAHANLRNAKAEFEKEYASAAHQVSRFKSQAVGPTRYLQLANDALDSHRHTTTAAQLRRQGIVEPRIRMHQNSAALSPKCPRTS